MGAAGRKIQVSLGSARNILPEMLNKKAKLLRDWSGGYMSMMEGIDETFDGSHEGVPGDALNFMNQRLVTLSPNGPL